MTLWLAFRLLKFLSLALFAGGLVLATHARRQPERVHAAWRIAPLGFFGSWIAGYGMLKATGVSMGAGWVSASMLASIVALHMAQLSARRVEAARWTGPVAWAALGASIGAMVGRAGPEWAAVAGLGALLGAGAALLLAPPREAASGEADRTLEHFWLWSRMEAISAILLFVVYMPLKYGAGIVLDGGQGWFGWLHGILTVIYLNGLGAAKRAGGWSWGTTALAFASSLLPFGALIFEYRQRRRTAP